MEIHLFFFHFYNEVPQNFSHSSNWYSGYSGFLFSCNVLQALIPWSNMVALTVVQHYLKVTSKECSKQRCVCAADSGICSWGILGTPLGTLGCLWLPGKGHHRKFLLWASSSTHFWQLLSTIPQKKCVWGLVSSWLLADAREGPTQWQGLVSQELGLCGWAWRRVCWPLDTAIQLTSCGLVP